MDYALNKLNVELPVNQATREAVEKREDILVIINGNCFRFKITDVVMHSFIDKVGKVIIEGVYYRI